MIVSTAIIYIIFIQERVVNIWNELPLNVVDFSILIAFKRSIEKFDLSPFCSVT